MGSPSEIDLPRARRAGAPVHLPERPTVAVVGATGLVGEVLLRVLAERRFPIGELRPLASERSAGTSVRWDGRELEVGRASPAAFEGVDLVLFAATGALSRELAPAAVEAGAIVVDKSSTWRGADDVPLVVPEINADLLVDRPGIVACPNCTTIGLVLALEPLRRAAGLRRVTVTTLQAVSGAGRDGLDELLRQTADLEAGRAPVPTVFSRPIAASAVPQCDRIEPDGFTGEERKLLLESRKILREPELRVTATCVRVPVPVGHGAAVLVETERALDAASARAALAAFPGVRVVDELAGDPVPVAADVAGTDEVLVGRVRRDPTGQGIWLWQVSDNLRRGAATNAVRIAEVLQGRP